MLLCGPQALAHVEAFIDFSEDELIEEGVLNQGTSFLPSCVGKMWPHSGLSGRRVAGEACPVGFPVWILGWRASVHLCKEMEMDC